MDTSRSTRRRIILSSSRTRMCWLPHAQRAGTRRRACTSSKEHGRRISLRWKQELRSICRSTQFTLVRLSFLPPGPRANLHPDTYSEHYRDLHAFFDSLPNLLRSPSSRFSFFHGLGATSRFFYDVYTEVSEVHLREMGLTTEWSEVEVGAGAVGVWEGTERRYWSAEVGAYRLPICWMEM